MKLYSRVLAALVLLMSFSAAKAQWVVIDPANLVENIMQQVSSYGSLVETLQQGQQMYRDYQQMLRDYDNQIKQLKAVTGSRGMAGLRNSLYDRDFIRRYMPADIEQAMNLRYGGGSGGTQRYAQTLRDIAARYALREVVPEFEHALSAPTAYKRIYDDQLRSSQAMLAAAQTSHYTIESRLTSIEDIMGAADGNGGEEADLKRAVDLNTRAVAESAFLQAEVIRLLSQQSVGQSLQEQQALTAQSRRRRVAGWVQRP